MLHMGCQGSEGIHNLGVALGDGDIRDLAKDSARSLSICLCNGQDRVKHREGGGPGGKGGSYGKGGAGVGPNENCQVPTRGFPSRMSY